MYRTRILWASGVILAVAAFSPTLADFNAVPLIDQNKILPEKEMEIQARGPVHEAFAQPTDSTPQPTQAVPKEPPQPIPEIPPDQKPEGENVQWIPGYWAWDADRNDYIWISGVYRNMPPGRQYVAGYWVQSPEGWRWVPGFWMDNQQQEIPYTAEPPPTLEYGPSIPPPDDNYFYVPGTWIYRVDRFFWRPGFWTPYRPGRVWIYSHWNWTPRGYVFVDGYWDWPLERRGLLFAPVHFHRPWWVAGGWYYRPAFSVGISTPWFSALFTWGPGRHYYFGDYYGSTYARRGFHPWHSHVAYRDPLLNYYRWNHRYDPGWHAGLRQIHADRLAGVAPLPPRTFSQQNLVLNQNIIVQNNQNKKPGNPNNFGPGLNAGPLVAPLNTSNNQAVKLAKLDNQQWQNQKQQADRFRELASVRKTFEGNPVNKNSISVVNDQARFRFPQDPNIAKNFSTQQNFAASNDFKYSTGKPKDSFKPYGSENFGTTNPKIGTNPSLSKGNINPPGGNPNPVPRTKEFKANPPVNFPPPQNNPPKSPRKGEPQAENQVPPLRNFSTSPSNPAPVPKITTQSPPTNNFPTFKPPTNNTLPIPKLNTPALSPAPQFNLPPTLPKYQPPPTPVNPQKFSPSTTGPGNSMPSSKSFSPPVVNPSPPVPIRISPPPSTPKMTSPPSVPRNISPPPSSSGPPRFQSSPPPVPRMSSPPTTPRSSGPPLGPRGGSGGGKGKR